METFAPIIGSLGLVTLIVGCCMFLPLPALRKRRSLAKKLAIGGGIAFVLGLVLTPEQRSVPATEMAVSAVPPSTPTPGAEAGSPKSSRTMQDDPSEVLMVARQTMMSVLFCKGELDQLQRAIDRASSGSGTPMQAYSAAHTAERDCKKMVAEAREVDRSPFKSAELNGVFSRAVPACQSVASIGTKAAATAKVVLDEDASMKTAQQYIDARNQIAGKVAECKLGLQGVTERAGVAKSDIDFLEV